MLFTQLIRDKNSAFILQQLFFTIQQINSEFFKEFRIYGTDGSAEQFITHFEISTYRRIAHYLIYLANRLTYSLAQRHWAISIFDRSSIGDSHKIYTVN